jgi:hypothetical protein
MTNRLDPGSIVVAGITLLLFVIALFVKGFTHDLLTETAIFLVSVKIIMMAYRNSMDIRKVNEKLDKIIQLEKDEGRCLENDGKNSKN